MQVGDITRSAKAGRGFTTEGAVAKDLPVPVHVSLPADRSVISGARATDR